MYVAKVEIENFRLFGAREDGQHCEVVFDPGLNLVVGENDSGKTCLIDAIRLLTGTVTADYFSITEDDFHLAGDRRSTRLRILAEFRGLDEAEAGALLEYLSITGSGEQSEFYLRMWLSATLSDQLKGSARKSRVETEFRAGSDEEGKRVELPARQLLRATYMKPLRDAVTELAAKKGSRLSQVLRAYPHIAGQEVSDWGGNGVSPTTLVGIMRRTEDELRKNAVIRNAEQELNEKYLQPFSLGDTALQGRIGVRPAVAGNLGEIGIVLGRRTRGHLARSRNSQSPLHGDGTPGVDAGRRARALTCARRGTGSRTCIRNSKCAWWSSSAIAQNMHLPRPRARSKLS